MNPTAIIQIGALILILILGAIQLKLMIEYEPPKRKERAFFLIPCLFWSAHALVFYAVAIGRNLFESVYLPTVFMTSWSAGLRIHLLITLVVKESVTRWRLRQYASRTGV